MAIPIMIKLKFVLPAFFWTITQQIKRKGMCLYSETEQWKITHFFKSLKIWRSRKCLTKPIQLSQKSTLQHFPWSITQAMITFCLWQMETNWKICVFDWRSLIKRSFSETIKFSLIKVYCFWDTSEKWRMLSFNFWE